MEIDEDFKLLSSNLGHYQKLWEASTYLLNHLWERKIILGAVKVTTVVRCYMQVGYQKRSIRVVLICKFERSETGAL